MDMNCLHVVECISGVDICSKCRRSEVAYQFLVNYLQSGDFVKVSKPTSGNVLVVTIFSV